MEKQKKLEQTKLREASMKNVNKQTGEIMDEKLNQVIYVETRRKDGSIRIQQDFKNCPTMAEQHTAHLTNLNYLIEKYKPDELAAYMAARESYRQEILGHDFSQEPNLQEAKNVVYQSKQAFEALPDDVKNNFQNHLEFLKFIDNPANQEKMVKLGLLSKKQIDQIKIPENPGADANTNDDVGGGQGEGKAKGSSKAGPT